MSKQEEQMEWESKAMLMDKERVSLSGQLEIQKKRILSLKTNIAAKEDIASERAILEVQDKFIGRMDDKDYSNGRFNRALVLNILDTVVKEYIRGRHSTAPVVAVAPQIETKRGLKTVWRNLF